MSAIQIVSDKQLAQKKRQDMQALSSAVHRCMRGSIYIIFAIFVIIAFAFLFFLLTIWWEYCKGLLENKAELSRVFEYLVTHGVSYVLGVGSAVIVWLRKQGAS